MRTTDRGVLPKRPSIDGQEKSGKGHLHKKKLQKELSDLDKEARKLKTRLKAIEQRRAESMKESGG